MITLLLPLTAVSGSPVPPGAPAGYISPIDKYAWSETSGWVNFRPTHGGEIIVHDTWLAGYAWAENIGWIKLGSNSGRPYANTTETNWGVNRSGSLLSGFGWSETSGWINFNPTNGGVTADPVTGQFDGYAWGENIGWIHFKNASPAYGVATVSIEPNKIGTYSNGDWYIDMNGNGVWDGEPTDTHGIFGIGLSSAVPVIGDWSGDGTLRMGIYADGYWYLDMNSNGQWDGAGTDTMAVFGAGLSNAVPVAGDWSGDGKSRIGVFADGYWYLDLNSNGQWDGAGTDTMAVFGVGLSNAVPVAGDWSGDGITKVGMFSNGYWYLDLDNNGQWDGAGTDIMAVFGAGLSNAVPVTGDWAGDGILRIGIYADGYWYLDMNGNGVWDGPPTDSLYFYGGMAGAVPVTGDWTGDGITRVGIYSDGTWYLDLNGNGQWDGVPTDAMEIFETGPGIVPIPGRW
ncbi:MAG: hypothetical protein EPN25_12945 [Nitrospirae bacterium]|nr:MAG: hypothetical protein EPN25_12945 [Nitrospirota bacterium]